MTSLNIHGTSSVVRDIMVATSRKIVFFIEHARSGQIEDYKIGICCFYAKQAALRRKSKDWLARNQNNVSDLDDMSVCRLLFQ